MRPLGASHLRMKKTVLVPVGMRVKIPYASRPRSLDKLLVQIFWFGPLKSCRYSKDWLVTSSMIELASRRSVTLTYQTLVPPAAIY